MKTNDEIALELAEEEVRVESEKHAPKTPHGRQVTGAKIAWMLGVIAIDAATAYAILQITLYWQYAALWFAAGAGGLLFSDWLREHVGNNDDQKRIAELGINVSLGAVLAMALLAGTVYVLGYSRLPWVEALVTAASVGLFFYHVAQAYRYYIIDDEYIAKRDEARAEAANRRDIARIHRAARKVAAKKQAEAVADKYRKDHGTALDAALKTAPKRPQEAPRRDLGAGGMVSYAAETDTVNPTSGAERR